MIKPARVQSSRPKLYGNHVDKPLFKGEFVLSHLSMQYKYANKKEVNPRFRNVQHEMSDYEEPGLLVLQYEQCETSNNIY